MIMIIINTSKNNHSCCNNIKFTIILINDNYYY